MNQMGMASKLKKDVIKYDYEYWIRVKKGQICILNIGPLKDGL